MVKFIPFTFLCFALLLGGCSSVPVERGLRSFDVGDSYFVPVNKDTYRVTYSYSAGLRDPGKVEQCLLYNAGKKAKNEGYLFFQKGGIGRKTKGSVSMSYMLVRCFNEQSAEGSGLISVDDAISTYQCQSSSQ